jgi:hypothetical protein
MVVVLTASLPVQSAPITTKVVSLNTVHFEVYSIQHYALKLVSDLRQGRWFYPGTLVSSINKTELYIEKTLEITSTGLGLALW